jgi:hypothetical protein
VLVERPELNLGDVCRRQQEDIQTSALRNVGGEHCGNPRVQGEGDTSLVDPGSAESISMTRYAGVEARPSVLRFGRRTLGAPCPHGAADALGGTARQQLRSQRHEPPPLGDARGEVNAAGHVRTDHQGGKIIGRLVASERRPVVSEGQQIEILQRSGTASVSQKALSFFDEDEPVDRVS